MPVARRAIESDHECASQNTTTVIATHIAVGHTSGSSSGPVAASNPATTIVP